MLIMSNHVNVEVMLHDLQRKLDIVHNWCLLNKLTVNESKTKYMIIRNGFVDPIKKLILNNRLLGRVTHYEYVGMVIEHKLNMDKQISSMYNKANRKLGILSKIRMFITSDTSARIYKTMIRPHMEYVDFIVESGSKKLVSRLDRLQERALCKIEYCRIPGNRKEYSALKIEYNIETLSKRRRRNLLRYMFLYSKNEINKVNHKSVRILRSDKKLNLKSKFSNLSKLHGSPFYRGVGLWNGLSCELQQCDSISEFKKMLKNTTV